MTAGRRNRLCIFERATVELDSYGGEIKTWSRLKSAWCEVKWGTGQERREAAQENATQAATFIADWNPVLSTLRPTDRIQGVGATWDITSIAPVGLNREIHITAVREADAG